jgi:hypothetical protein
MASSITLKSIVVLDAINTWERTIVTCLTKNRELLIEHKMSKPHRFSLFSKKRNPTREEAIAILIKDYYYSWGDQFHADVDGYVSRLKQSMYGDLIILCRANRHGEITVHESYNNCRMLDFVL